MSARIIPLAPPAQVEARISDEALVAACAAGDESALRILYRRHEAALHRFLSRMLGRDAVDVEDLVQQTFLTAWESAGRFRGEARVSSWLFGIGANLARARRRTHLRREGLLARFLPHPEVAPVATDEVLAHRQTLARLMEALEALPHDLRVAFVMCEIEEIPGTEAARALGLRPGTLWRRLHDARRRLRAALQEDLP
jgi:RNA polymerase sigma-70 factor (ECF subfamily)